MTPHLETVDLLEVDGLSVQYGRVLALRDVSLHVRPGEIVAVVGANGAGKTTLLNALMAAIPSQGSIRFAGIDHTALATMHELARRGMALVPEQLCLFGSMTVEDNLRLGAYRLRTEGRSAADAMLDEVCHLFPRLRERRWQLASTLSGGERRMLGIGRALMGRPRILLLDEPSLGLAPMIVRELFDAFASLQESGVSLLLVEQHVREALQIAQRCYMLHLGQIAFSGAASALANDPRIEAAYLGATEKA